MNWNNNDTKYIIKKIISYFLICLFLFLISSCKAKAETHTAFLYSNNYNYTISTQDHGELNIPVMNENGSNYNAFVGAGEGNVIFTITEGNSTATAGQIRSVSVKTSDLTGTFICDIGSVLSYTDSYKQRVLYTANCPVNLNSGIGIKYIYLTTMGGESGAVVSTSSTMTFVKKDSLNVNVNQQQVVNAITASQQATINAISSASNQAHTDAQQAHTDAQQAHTDAQQIHNAITNDNVDGAKSDMDDFNNNSAFTDSTGLQAVIELPLNLVNSFTNTCQPISITIPWLNYTGTIPCMSTIYKSHFNNLYNVVKLIVNAFFIYRILLKIYELVHEAKQPDEDKLEVIEL